MIHARFNGLAKIAIFLKIKKLLRFFRFGEKCDARASSFSGCRRRKLHGLQRRMKHARPSQKKHCTEHRPQQRHVIIWSDAPTPKARETFSAQTEIFMRNRRTASEETIKDTVVLSNSESLTKGIELAVRALFPPVVSHSMSATSGARPAKGTTT